MTTPTTTQTEKFIGNRYNLTLIYDPADGYFEIVTTYREDQCKSSVTNLNKILSEVFDNVLTSEEIMAISDSWLHVENKKKFEKLVKKARKYLQEVDSHLEDALDVDMKEGGWNSR
jgi:methyltransferase-like protein